MNATDEQEHMVEVEGINPFSFDFKTCWTRNNRDKPFERRDVLLAIIAARGSFIHMSMLLGRRRNSIKDYVYGNPDVLEFYKEHFEGLIDKIEYNHMQAAIDGDGSAQRFVLSTVGKDRGYTTRVEQTGKDGKDLNNPVDLSKFSDEELVEFQRLMAKASAK